MLISSCEPQALNEISLYSLGLGLGARQRGGSEHFHRQGEHDGRPNSFLDAAGQRPVVGGWHPRECLDADCSPRTVADQDVLWSQAVDSANEVFNQARIRSEEHTSELQ